MYKNENFKQINKIKLTSKFEKAFTLSLLYVSCWILEFSIDNELYD